MKNALDNLVPARSFSHSEVGSSAEEPGEACSLAGDNAPLPLAVIGHLDEHGAGSRATLELYLRRLLRGRRKEQLLRDELDLSVREKEHHIARANACGEALDSLKAKLTAIDDSIGQLHRERDLVLDQYNEKRRLYEEQVTPLLQQSFDRTTSLQKNISGIQINNEKFEVMIDQMAPEIKENNLI